MCAVRAADLVIPCHSVGRLGGFIRAPALEDFLQCMLHVGMYVRFPAYPRWFILTCRLIFRPRCSQDWDRKPRSPLRRFSVISRLLLKVLRFDSISPLAFNQTLLSSLLYPPDCVTLPGKTNKSAIPGCMLRVRQAVGVAMCCLG